ncbi:Protein atonal 8 [Merluccius polli]|uniref:Protein atonal homolog 8 n=1 Tax=Merluccius polli TaxID=89951 RepID=A0AA47N9Z0_MERPO|nr:Protein atonal 8 [Merluccius polli]
MRNPHVLTDEWTKPNSTNADGPVQVVSVPGMNKKFKRKSRQPKRLYSSATLDHHMGDFQQQDAVSADETTQEEPCVRRHNAPVPKHSFPHQPAAAAGTGTGTEVTDGQPPVTSGQSDALDMRIGITAKLSRSPVSPLAHLRASRWSSSSGSPQRPSGTTLGAALGFPDRAPPVLHPHPYCQDRSQVPVPGHLRGGQDRVLLPGSAGAYQAAVDRSPDSCCQEDSPKESGSRKRPGIGPDPPPGFVPEIKAVQQTRRLLANARERTRVHTISAAFEALRKQVPCYSYGQKLSKLAILRIACNYILSLAQLAELDYASTDHSSLTFSQCVEQCTRTLQAEGRSKKRKE